MKDNIKRFCENYKKKLSNDKDIEENKIDFMSDYRDRITFRVNVQSHSPTSKWLGPNIYTGNNLFVLDEEDLEYLYNKYSDRIEDEMNKNIEEVKQRYKKILG